MDHEVALNIINKTTYSRPDVIKYYSNTESLLKAEDVLLKKLAPTIKDSRILDIGIGGGRTTNYLLKISEDYTGVDYVQQFAEETQEKYPEANILCRDATNMAEFESETYDFVLFSYNGIDSISHAQRLLVLKEANRVLKKGGVFMFSSHNRDYKYFNKLPWRRRIEFSKNFFKFYFYCLYHLPKHYKMKRHEIFTEEFAFLNDGDHRYSLLLYYISIDKQRKQLDRTGFSSVEAYDLDGKLTENDHMSHWIYYLATK